MVLRFGLPFALVLCASPSCQAGPGARLHLAMPVASCTTSSPANLVAGGSQLERLPPPPPVARPSEVRLAAYERPADEPPEPEQLGAPLPAEPNGDVTLAELEQSALANNPTLRMAASQLQKERGSWLQAGLWPNPVGGYLRSDPDAAGQSQTSGGFVQQTFVMAGKLQLAREQEDFGIQDASRGLEAQRQRVLNDVRVRYFEVLGAQHLLAVARKMEKLASEGLDVIRRAVRDGEADPVDSVRAEMQLNRMRLAVRSAEAQVLTTWQSLMDMTGTPDVEPKYLAGDLAEDNPPLDSNEQWGRLLAENPLLRQLSAQVGVARKAWELAVAQRIPDVTGQVVIERDSTQKVTTFQTLLALPVPLFNRNQGAIYSAWHEVQRAEAEIARTQLALRDSFEASFRSYADALNRVETLHHDLLPAAVKGLELTIQAHQTGERSLSDVLDARQLYFETELEYAAALTDLRVAEVEVLGMQLSGGLNPAEIGTAIQSSGGTSAQRRALQQLLEQQQRGKLKPFTPGTTGE